MTKKTYTQPSLTAYGSVEKLTKGSGSIDIGDSIIFTDLPFDLPDQEVEGPGGSSDLVIPVGS